MAARCTSQASAASITASSTGTSASGKVPLGRRTRSSLLLKDEPPAPLLYVPGAAAADIFGPLPALCAWGAPVPLVG